MTPAEREASSRVSAVGDAETPTKRRRPPVPVIIALVLGLAAAVYGVERYIHGLSYEDSDDAFIDGTVAQVSPRVPGHILEVDVSDNQHVAAGELLCTLDPADFEAALAGAKAALAAAQARAETAAADLAMIRKTAPAEVEKEQGSVAAAEAAQSTAQVRLALAQSMLAQAKARVSAAEAAVEQAQAAAEAAEAEASRAESDLARYQALFDSGGITAAQLDQFTTAATATGANARATQRGVAAAQAQVVEAQAGLQSAQESVRQAESQINESAGKADEARGGLAKARVADERIARAEAQRAQALADVEQSAAAVQQAELNLSYTRIVAPITGTVTKKSIEVGTYARPGQALMAIVSDDKWVVANFKETQLERMRVGQPVAIRIDAYPDLHLHGHIDSMQRGTGSRFSLLPAENATGNYVKVVQRVPVKIVLDDPLPEDRPIALGLSVVPEVKVN